MGNTQGIPDNKDKDIIIKESNNIFMKKGEVSLDSNEELTIELLKKINQLERKYENINKDICNKISITIDNTLNKMSVNRLRDMNKMIVGQEKGYELRISEYVMDNDEFIADELKDELLNIFDDIKNLDTENMYNYFVNNIFNNLIQHNIQNNLLEKLEVLLIYLIIPYNDIKINVIEYKYLIIKIIYKKIQTHLFVSL